MRDVDLIRELTKIQNGIEEIKAALKEVHPELSSTPKPATGNGICDDPTVPVDLW